ncbi:TPA: phage tail protein [Salmonella enterica]|nr:phage tail protein [Salmonella enterica]
MAESQFYAILTDQGAALEATALATGIPVTLDKFVIGDGGGNAVTPDPTRTTLVNEVYRGTIQKAESQDNQVTFTLYVPPEAGGYTIREAGILTADGTLYSLSNSPDILKPTESNGAVISITFKYILAVSSTSTVNIVVYDDYLTPEAADEKYLQISKNLSEIKDKGEDAQKTSRENIGIEGDIAYRDKDNKFTKPNTFDNYLISNLSLRICAPNDKKLICDISGAYVDLTYKTTFARIRSVSGNLVGGAYHFLVNSPDELILEDTSNKKKYTTYNTGNLTPVLSVNNSRPDASGNVTVSTGSTVDLSNYYTKSEVDALINSDDYASATPGAVRSYGTFTTIEYSVLNAPSEGAKLNGSAIKFAGISETKITSGSSPAGIWRVVSPANLGTDNNLFFAVRIS